MMAPEHGLTRRRFLDTMARTGGATTRFDMPVPRSRIPLPPSSVGAALPAARWRPVLNSWNFFWSTSEKANNKMKNARSSVMASA